MFELIIFALLSLVIFDNFFTFLELGGCKIRNKDHLSPAEAEIGAELGDECV